MPRATIILIAISTLAFIDQSLAETKTSSALRGIIDKEKHSIFITKKIQVTDEYSTREKRSPQFDDYFDDYSNDSNGRHLKLGHRRKKHRKPHLLGLFGGHGGCRGHGCGQGHGWRPQPGGYYHRGPRDDHRGSPHNGAGQSQTNAESATLSFGPYSATFSHADLSAGNRSPQDYFDY